MDNPERCPQGDDRPPFPYQLSTRRAAAYADASHRWHQVITVVGRAVKEIRTTLGWSQQQLADRAIVSQGAVSRIESGTTDNIPFRTVAQVLQILGHGASHAGLQLAPATQALVQFVDPSIGRILAAEIDPQFAALAQHYHRLRPQHRIAVVQFLAALTADAVIAEDDHIPPPLGG